MLIGLFLIASSAHALASNAYDQNMLDCLDYYHSPKTAQEINACHQNVLGDLQKSPAFQQNFLDCVDYYHSRVTMNKEIACAQEASSL